MERCAGERGKGFFWSVDENFVQSFEEQEARHAHIAGSASPQISGMKVTAGKSRRGGAALSEPPLKRSVRMGVGPLPPPLTNTPLAMKSGLVPTAGSVAVQNPYSQLPPQPGPSNTNPGPAMTTTPTTNLTTTTKSVTIAATQSPNSVHHTSTEAATTAAAQSTSFISSLPPSVCIPIVIGQAPPSAIANSASSTTHLPTPPIVLHENTLILNPSVFSHLTPEQLKELEALGAQKALEILQSYIVRFLKERIRGEKDGSKGGRGRGRGRSKRGGVGGSGRGGTPAGGASGPFTTTPLPNPAQNKPISSSQGSLLESGQPEQASTSSSVPAVDDSTPDASVQVSVPLTPPRTYTTPQEHTSESPIIVVDDDDDELEGPAMKRRRLDGHGGAVAT